MFTIPLTKLQNLDTNSAILVLQFGLSNCFDNIRVFLFVFNSHKVKMDNCEYPSPEQIDKSINGCFVKIYGNEL